MEQENLNIISTHIWLMEYFKISSESQFIDFYNNNNELPVNQEINLRFANDEDSFNELFVKKFGAQKLLTPVISKETYIELEIKELTDKVEMLFNDPKYRKDKFVICAKEYIKYLIDCKAEKIPINDDSLENMKFFYSELWPLYKAITDSKIAPSVKAQRLRLLMNTFIYKTYESWHDIAMQTYDWDLLKLDELGYEIYSRLPIIIRTAIMELEFEATTEEIEPIINTENKLVPLIDFKNLQVNALILYYFANQAEPEIFKPIDNFPEKTQIKRARSALNLLGCGMSAENFASQLLILKQIESSVKNKIIREEILYVYEQVKSNKNLTKIEGKMKEYIEEHFKS